MRCELWAWGGDKLLLLTTSTQYTVRGKEKMQQLLYFCWITHIRRLWISTYMNVMHVTKSEHEMTSLFWIVLLTVATMSGLLIDLWKYLLLWDDLYLAWTLVQEKYLSSISCCSLCLSASHLLLLLLLTPL